MYVNEQSLDLDSVWNEHAVGNDLVIDVTATAHDSAAHTTTTTVRVHLVRFLAPDSVVRFDQTLYEFHVVESLAANETIGYVNSARFYRQSTEASSIIYEIVDGDDVFDDLRLDYRTGRIYSTGNLDFEQKPNYSLGLS